MKTLVIYKSIHHQNTKKIAEAIAKVLKAELKTPSKVNIKELEKYDLIGFGSGIYWMKHHQDLFDLVKKLKKYQDKKAFIFSTRGARLIITGHQELKASLKTKGFKIIGEFSCLSHDSVGPLRLVGGINKGRPNKKDIKRAQEFAKSLLKNRS